MYAIFSSSAFSSAFLFLEAVFLTASKITINVE
jgi:hypothetical protein